MKPTNETPTPTTPGFTPGPWRIGNYTTERGTYNPNVICDENLNGICSVCEVPLHTTLEALVKSGNTSDAEGLANARLIAQSPALYEALRELSDAASSMDTSYKTSDFLPGEKSRRYFTAIEKARAVLAAVEGGAK